jgi:hypothetical protein
VKETTMSLSFHSIILATVVAAIVGVASAALYVGAGNKVSGKAAGLGFVPNRLVSEREHAIAPAPAPVTGVLLFDETELGACFDSGRESCVSAARVLGIFAREIEIVGGKIQTLSGRPQQDFADQWPLNKDNLARNSGPQFVPVSPTLRHLNGDQRPAVAAPQMGQPTGKLFKRRALRHFEGEGASFEHGGHAIFGSILIENTLHEFGSLERAYMRLQTGPTRVDDN